MTQEKQQPKTGLMSSKYLKMLLILIMALLLFGGPYILYVLYDVLKVRFLISGVIGFGSVLLGLILMWYLIKTKVIS
jgi:cytochrome c oxidase assembly factor CtaG